MRTNATLWLSIVDTFARIGDACARAHAAEAVLERRALGEEVIRDIAAGGRGVSKGHSSALTVGMPGQVVVASGPIQAPVISSGPELVQLRAEIRNALGELRGRLGEVLGERDVYSVLFPIVVYSDEKVAAATSGAAMGWESMQEELYGIENGGELFYELLDERIRQDETHPLVFEVFYYCLVDGFCGMYEAGAKHLEECKSRLLSRIRLSPIRFPEQGPEPRKPELVRFPWQYYGLAALAVIVTYLVLQTLADLQDKWT